MSDRLSHCCAIQCHNVLPERTLTTAHPRRRIKTQPARPTCEWLSQHLLCLKNNHPKAIPKRTGSYDVFSNDPPDKLALAGLPLSLDMPILPALGPSGPPIRLELNGRAASVTMRSTHLIGKREDCLRGCESGLKAGESVLSSMSARQDDMLDSDIAGTSGRPSFATLPARFKALPPLQPCPLPRPFPLSDMDVADFLKPGQHMCLLSADPSGQAGSPRTSANSSSVRSTSTTSSTLYSGKGDSGRSSGSHLRTQSGKSQEDDCKEQRAPKLRKWSAHIRQWQFRGSPPPPVPALPLRTSASPLTKLFHPNQPDHSVVPDSESLLPYLNDEPTPRPPRIEPGAEPRHTLASTPTKLYAKRSFPVLRLRTKSTITETSPTTTTDRSSASSSATGHSGSGGEPPLSATSSGKSSYKTWHTAASSTWNSVLDAHSRLRGEGDGKERRSKRSMPKRLDSSVSGQQVAASPGLGSLTKSDDSDSEEGRLPSSERTRPPTLSRASRAPSSVDTAGAGGALPSFPARAGSSASCRSASPFQSMLPSKLLPKAPSPPKTKIRLKGARLRSSTLSNMRVAPLPDPEWPMQWCIVCSAMCTVHSPDVQDPFANLSGAPQLADEQNRHLQTAAVWRGQEAAGQFGNVRTRGRSGSVATGAHGLPNANVGGSLGRVGCSAAQVPQGRRRSLSLTAPRAGFARPAARTSPLSLRFKGTWCAQPTIVESSDEGVAEPCALSAVSAAGTESQSEFERHLSKKASSSSGSSESSFGHKPWHEHWNPTQERNGGTTPSADTVPGSAAPSTPRSSPSVWSQPSPPGIAGIGAPYALTSLTNAPAGSTLVPRPTAPLLVQHRHRIG